MAALRIGILGTGGMACAHAAAFQNIRGVTLAACCDVVPGRAEAFAATHGIALATDRRERLFAVVDAVSIVTPDRFHAEPTIAALRAGKHVLCEKPLIVTLDEAPAVVAVARARPDLIGVVNLSYRRSAAAREAAALVAAGTFGALRHFDLDDSEETLQRCLGRDVHSDVWKSRGLKSAPTVWQRFVRAIKTGRPEQPDIARGADVQAMLDACFRSSASGGCARQRWRTPRSTKGSAQHDDREHLAAVGSVRARQGRTGPQTLQQSARRRRDPGDPTGARRVQVLQIEPGQAHAPAARAMVDIVQRADDELGLSYRGHRLRHRRFACHEHLSQDKGADAKTLDDKLKRLRKRVDPERERLARLKSELAFQDSQRARGVYRPDTPPIVSPRGAAGRCGLRPAQPAAPQA